MQECWRHVQCGGNEEAQAGRETSKGVICNKVGSGVKGKRMTQKEAPFDTFILGEGDTAQEAGQEEIPSSSPSLPPHYNLPPIYPIAAYSLSSPTAFLSV